ncbi:hypothetical protein Bca4012_034523 [Brassica carinata]
MRVNSQVHRQGDWCIANHVTDNGRLQKNIDFASQGRHQRDCYFEGSGLITVTDPSYESCKYQYHQEFFFSGCFCGLLSLRIEVRLFVVGSNHANLQLLATS